jgi:hypothetical protein
MSQANVYSSVANATWYTDKCEIVTGNTAVTYNVYATALGTNAPVGNIWSAAPSIPLGSKKQIYVGAGNKLTVTGANFTAAELGTASSAQEGVIGYGSQ